jgi:hypothetical protein
MECHPHVRSIQEALHRRIKMFDSQRLHLFLFVCHLLLIYSFCPLILVHFVVATISVNQKYAHHTHTQFPFISSIDHLFTKHFLHFQFRCLHGCVSHGNESAASQLPDKGE